MAASRSPERKDIVEFKHPAVQSFEDFYTQLLSSIPQLMSQFIQGKVEVEEKVYYLFTCKKTLTEHTRLFQWVYAHYGVYLDADGAGSARLTPRERTLLGMVYEFGIYGDSDKAKAIICYKQSSAEGDDLANLYLSFSCSEEIDRASCIKLLSNSSTPFILCELGLQLELSGQHQKALTCYKLSAEGDIGAAHRNLGLCYQKGELGVPIDRDAARRHFMRSIELGLSKTLSDLGNGCAHDDEDIVQDKGLAKQLLEAAVKRFDTPGALVGLGRVSLESKRIDEAASYFRRAANLSSKKERSSGISKLWGLFQEQKTNSAVCYHAALGLQYVGDEEQKNETRTEFNKLLRSKPGDVLDLCLQWGDPLKNLYPLIDLDPLVRERLACTYNVLAEKVMPRTGAGGAVVEDVSKIILEFEHPVPDVVRTVIEKEPVAKRFLATQKLMTVSDMNTLFGCRDHLAVIHDAESHIISYDKAARTITGK